MGISKRGIFVPSGKQRGNTTRDNKKQNKQAKEASKDFGLNKKQQREMHDGVSKQGFGRKELHDFVEGWFEKKKEKSWKIDRKNRKKR